MIKRLFLAICLFNMCLLTAAPTASAYNLLGGVDCSKAGSSAVCNPGNGNNPISGNNGLLLSIVNIVAFVAGVAAIIVIIISALKFITSGSDTSKGGRVDADVENARRALVTALIGLAVIILGKVLITFVLGKL